jgi:DNA modification methylase
MTKEAKMIQGNSYTVHIGSNLDILPTLADNSIDAIVTDPPYGLSDNKFVADTIAKWISGERDFIPDGKGFMGKSWDAFVPPPALWDECLRVLKPGGHLLAFFGSRTQDIGALSIRLAGFEIRDSIAWMYGSGFPKSLDISKAIDKAAGAEREVLTETVEDLFGERQEKKEKPASGIGQNGAAFSGHAEGAMQRELGNPATPEAQQWEGWGTALKPAFEPVIVARKPLIGTVAENVLTHGTGGLNIDGSRIGTGTGEKKTVSYPDIRGDNYQQGKESYSERGTVEREVTDKGRWPSNVILDPYTAELLDEQSDASRFFYVAKASKRDRNEGLVKKSDQRSDTAAGLWAEMEAPKQNFHPTVKPTDLMRYLVKLVTPPGGVVLDPFTGSGSTGKAAILEGFDFIGIELTEDYIPIIEGRLAHAEKVVAELKEKEKEALF